MGAAGLATLPIQGLRAPPADAAAPLPPKPVLAAPPAASSAAACAVKGAAAARDPAINRGCATAQAARQQYSLQGLLPPRQVGGRRALRSRP
jgi:hypothetical protein